MTRRKQILTAVSAAIAILSVSYLAVRPMPAPEGVPLPVPARAIEAGARIEASMLTVLRVPADLVPPDAVLSAEDAVGRTSAVPLFPGEILLRGRLAERAEGTLHPGAGPGRRIYALSLAAEDAGGWWLSAGSTVDVHILPVRSEDGTAQEVMPGLRVAELLDSRGNPAGPGTEGGAPSILCLDVDAAQAYRLAEAEAGRRIKVTIVNETTSTQGGNER